MYDNMALNEPRSTIPILVVLLLLIPIGCTADSVITNGESVQRAAFPDATTPHGIGSLAHYDELLAYLDGKFVQEYLGVEKTIVLETGVEKVIIGCARARKPLGEVYYTIQDGWHLKRENERMEYVPGKGWLIWEQ